VAKLEWTNQIVHRLRVIDTDDSIISLQIELIISDDGESRTLEISDDYNGGSVYLEGDLIFHLYEFLRTFALKEDD